jgi:hypothetical protein
MLPDSFEHSLLMKPAAFQLPRSFVFNCLMLIWSMGTANAANWSSLLDEFVGAGKVSKGSSHAADETAGLIRGTPRLKDAAAREAKNFGVNAGNRAAIRQVLIKNLQKTGGDSATLRFVDELPDTDLDAALVYLRGGRRLQETVPDIAIRARLAKSGGAPALASLGLRDNVFVEDFIKLDALTAAGSVPAQIAGKSTLARLGELLSDGSERFADFYTRYIRGNEGKWVAGGALTWWLKDPDSFQDATGQITKTGFQKLTELAGHATASALAGIAEGGKEAGREIVAEVAKGFFEGGDAWAAWIALVAFIYAVGLFLPATRALFLKPLRALLRPRGTNS